MESITLEELIRQHIRLSHTNAKGWYPCVHLSCDHGNKGERAAFKFDNHTVGFHCFNCGVKTKYDPASHKSIPQKLVAVLADFNIDQSEVDRVEFSNLATDFTTVNKSKKETISITPKVLEMPEEFYLLSTSKKNDPWATIAKEYLTHERGIDWKSYPFMLSTKSNNMLMRKWIKRLIIPIFQNKKLVFYQGRDLTGKNSKKYQSATTITSKVLSNFDTLIDYTNTNPIYIVEGWFDAHLINGIALFGNSISEEQSIWLNKTPREKIFIPDRFGNGKEVALHALQLGWSISTPDIGSGSNCKDVTDIIFEFGKLYTMKTLAERATNDPVAAKLQLELYCK